MKDSFYSTKRYIGKYTPIFTFEEFGDTTNYFIKLQYLCNRDDYQSIRNPKGTALDFALKNQDGDAIFGDITESHLELLKSRTYTIEAEAVPVENNEDDRLVEVAEIYVYNPDKEFLEYDSEIVPIWGIEDDTAGASTTLVSGSNNVYSTTSMHSEVVFASVEDFKTGDVVTLTFTANWRYDLKDPTENITTHTSTCELIPTQTHEILSIQGNVVEFTSRIDLGDVPELPLAEGDWLGVYWIDMIYNTLNTTEFFKGFVGTIPQTPYMWYNSCVVEKDYSNRAYTKRLGLVKKLMSWTKEVPTLPERFAPSNGVGTEKTIISRATTTSPTEWKAKVSAGDWYIYTEPELEYDSELGMYRLEVKYTKCL